MGTKKTCRLKYNMTKTHSQLFVWSESELVDVKTPTIEQGDGGEPGILVMEVSANTHPAEDTAFVFVSNKMKPHTSYYCDALEFNLTTTGEDGAPPPAQITMRSPTALSAAPPAAPGAGDNLLQTRLLNPADTSMPVTPAHNHTAGATQSGRPRTAEDVLIDVHNVSVSRVQAYWKAALSTLSTLSARSARPTPPRPVRHSDSCHHPFRYASQALGVSSTVSEDVIKALSERVLALEKTTNEKLEAAKEATEKAQKLALETIEAATKDDADVKGDGDAGVDGEEKGDGKRSGLRIDMAGVAKLKVDMHVKLVEAQNRLKPLDERIELEGYAWDLCVVFPEDAEHPGQLTKEGKSIVEKVL